MAKVVTQWDETKKPTAKPVWVPEKVSLPEKGPAIADLAAKLDLLIVLMQRTQELLFTMADPRKPETPKPKSVEFVVVERDAKNRVKRFRVDEQ